MKPAEKNEKRLSEKKRRGAAPAKGGGKVSNAGLRGRSDAHAAHYHVLHHEPGRVRLSVPGLRRASLAELKTLARELKNELIPGKVLAVRANPLTGSVTLTYDAAATDILSWVDAILLREDVARLLGRAPQ